MGDDLCLICGVHVGYCMGNCSEPSDGSNEMQEDDQDEVNRTQLTERELNGLEEAERDQYEAELKSLGDEYRRGWD